MINTDKLIEVRLDEPDDFLKIKETLTRIGIASKRDKRLFQSCHILHKRGKYYIVHFKQMFMLDGKDAQMSTDDVNRLHTIASLLHEWGLLKLADISKIYMDPLALKTTKIISHKEKSEWKLESKYTIGKKLHQHNGDQ